jgi:hypothetical protein
MEKGIEENGKKDRWKRKIKRGWCKERKIGRRNWRDLC